MRLKLVSKMVAYGMTAALVLVIFVTPSKCQIESQIPEGLRSSLEARLKLFTQAQAEGRWDTVSSLLGRYRRNIGLYTQAHKECLISQMQSAPMISFVVPDKQFSPYATMPPRQNWWDLEGETITRTKSGDHKGHTMMDAYRDGDEWYFSPPNYDEYWLKAHLSEAELSADYSDEIVTPSDPTSPLEILDLHAFLNKESLTVRDVTFKLRNRSSKTVTAFNLRLGGEQYGAGCEMQPGSFRDEKMTSPRYGYFFCEGVKREKLMVDSVSFADGSGWEPHKKKGSEKDALKQK
jgi:hypothetical protein